MTFEKACEIYRDYMIAEYGERARQQPLVPDELLSQWDHYRATWCLYDIDGDLLAEVESDGEVSDYMIYI